MQTETVKPSLCSRKTDRHSLPSGSGRLWEMVLAISLLGLMLRVLGFFYLSPDMEEFLLPWFEEIKAMGGFPALSEQVGNYNIPYQVLICIMTYLPFPPVVMYKLLSVLFDYLLAVAVAVLVCVLRGERNRGTFLLSYAAVLAVPPIISNSSWWGQCDSIYVFFVVLAVYFLYRNRLALACVWLGAAFSMKLQTVFIFPFVVYYVVSGWHDQKHRFWGLLFIPGVSLLCGLPAVFYGRPVWAGISVYLEQTDTYHSMSLNMPNIWMLLQADYEHYKMLAILLTMCVLAAGLLAVWILRIRLLEAQPFMDFAIWSVWTVVMFLPAMHERYAYMLDVLLLAAALWKGKRYGFFAVSSILISWCSYGFTIFPEAVSRLTAVYAVVLYIVFSVRVWTDESYISLRYKHIKSGSF